jgi:hypothetical protein
MATPRPWTVLPHGPLERLEDNLWAVSGTLPRGAMNRRMAIVRLADGALVFHNAVPLEEATMREVAALGRPAFLVVPNRVHRLDAFAFKQRHPGLRVVCPARSRRDVEARVAVDGTLDALPRDPALTAIPLEGSRWGEAALLVRSASGTRATLVFADTVMNVPDSKGLSGTFLRLLGTSGGPRVTGIARLFTVGDRRALAMHLHRLADTPGLVRLTVSHGVDVTEDAPAVLRRVAAELAGGRG